MHLGAEPDVGKNQRKIRASEIWRTFENLITVCEEEKIDLLLIAGDLFHRQPLLRELREVDHLFGGLTKTRVVIIAGNHDYIKSNSYYRTFEWSPNVTFLGSDRPECVEFAHLDTAVYGLSYHERESKEPVYEKIQIHDSCKNHILLAHGGDEKHFPFRKSVVERLGFDYIALGHIHKPGALIPDYMIYSGALEPIDKNDTGAHGYVKGELTKKGCRTAFVPFAKREYIHLELEIEEHMTGFAVRKEIQRAIKENGEQNIYKVILEGFKDPEVRFDFGGVDVYGNIIEICDHTKPSYDFYRLLQKNRGNLLGKYIESFGEASPGTIEYDALCEGVQALMETSGRNASDIV